MQVAVWTALVLATFVCAQSVATVCQSYDYVATTTFTDYSTYYLVNDTGTQLVTTSFLNSRSTVLSSSCDTSTVLVATNTVTPSMLSPTLAATTITVTITTTLSVATLTTTATLTATATSTLTVTIVPSTISSSSSTSTSVAVSTSSTTPTLVTTSTSISTSGATLTATSTTSVPVVTDQAYIDTILRHHNQHRLNHTSGAVVWNASLAETARKIANSCVYQHDTATDCTAGGPVCYGQNIAAGYLTTQMSSMVSDGFYNSEVNSYTYYGGEPDIDTFQSWGHFSQIVWKIDTHSVGCYTTNCTSAAGGLTFPNGGGQDILPFFTVCNYGGPGNYIGDFTDNVIAPIGLPSIFAGYMCPTLDNCEGQ